MFAGDFGDAGRVVVVEQADGTQPRQCVDRSWNAQLGVLAGLVTYNVLAALILASASAGLKMAGVLLWPAVVYHAALAGWCIACLPRGRAAGRL